MKGYWRRSQLRNISENKFSTVFGLYYIDQTIKWHPHYLPFTPNPDCNHDWCRSFSLGTASRCSPPSPWPVPRLRDPGIGASAKPGHQTTPARHNMTSTVETCTTRKGRFSHKQNSKSRVVLGNRQTNKDFFPVVFRCFGCKSALVSPLGCKRWIGESMEKPAFLKLVRNWCEEVWRLPNHLSR